LHGVRHVKSACIRLRGNYFTRSEWPILGENPGISDSTDFRKL
jgi:hypothetical protein